ncbi:MAG: hypothetical protein ABEH88_05240 [Halobacteriales archaeon]
MTRERLAARLGVVAAAAVVVLTAIPYALTESTGISTYYGVGVASPVFVSLLAVVGAITLLSAAKGRSDPALAAGAAVTVAAFAVVIALLWAIPARDVAFGLNLRADPLFGSDPTTWFSYHPVLVVLSTLVLAAASALYTRTVL